MDDAHDLDGATESAWRTFRRRLADRLHELDEGEVIALAYDVPVDEAEGCAPYVQFLGLAEAVIDAEVSSNAYLHPDHAIADEGPLVELGWAPSDDPSVTLNYGILLERRRADELAVMTVRALREVFGVPHPAFLDAPALDEGSAEEPEPVAPDDEPSDDEVVVPRDTDHLRSLVDHAVAAFFGADDVEHDDDGDIPVPRGRNLMFVRVDPDKPVVELFAHAVVGLDDVAAEALGREVDLLNRSHGPWRFYSAGDRIVMSYEVPALPFAPLVLRIAFFRFAEALESVAPELALRLRARCYLDPVPPAQPADLVFAGLLELMRGRVRTATVAGLFEGDRVAIIQRLVAVRRGQLDCEEHDPDAVLDVLRRALRLASDGVDPDRVPRKVAPRRPRPTQTSLLSGPEAGEDSFELDWTA